jgi:hypothetical protein
LFKEQQHSQKIRIFFRDYGVAQYRKAEQSRSEVSRGYGLVKKSHTLSLSLSLSVFLNSGFSL